MPQVTLNFPDENAIPAELKAFKSASSNAVTVWVGDKVAEETNPGLASNRDALKTEKETLQARLDSEKSKWETTNNTLSQEVISLREKVATASGNTVTPDDIAILEAVKPFGSKPDEIKSKLEAADSATTENAQLKRNLLVQNASSILGYDPTALSNLLDHPVLAKDLELVIEDVTENDKPIKKVFANVKNAAGSIEKKEFSKFVQETSGWQTFLPVLQSKSDQATWLPQSPTPSGPNGPQTGNRLQSHIDAKNQAAKAAPNPLRPTPTPVAQQPPTT